jgi:hypothetical protein
VVLVHPSYNNTTANPVPFTKVCILEKRKFGEAKSDFSYEGSIVAAMKEWWCF